MPVNPPGGINTGTLAPTGASPANPPALPGAGPQVLPPPSTATPPSPLDDADASKAANVILDAQFAEADAKAQAANAHEAAKDGPVAQAAAQAQQDAQSKEFNERFGSNMSFPFIFQAWNRAKFEQQLHAQLATNLPADQVRLRNAIKGVESGYAAMQFALENLPKF